MRPVLPLCRRKGIRFGAEKIQILKIMVSENEIQRLVQTADNVLVVRNIQIAGTKYTVDVPETILDIMRVDQGVDMIGDGQDIQLPSLTSFSDSRKSSWSFSLGIRSIGRDSVNSYADLVKLELLMK